MLLLAGVAAPSAAAASGAHLDTEFGAAGIRYLPSQFGRETGIGLLDDGRVVVANSDEVLALLPSGQADPSFGRAGSAAFAVPSGGEGVYATALGVDGEGRPVAVGQAVVDGSESLTPTLEPFVERFTAAGMPDPTFGGGAGYLVGGIALPPPEPGSPPAAYVDDLGFDSAGRIIVSGRTDVGLVTTKTGPGRDLEPFLARLDGSGSIDRSFSGNGTYLGPRGPWGVAPGDRLILESPRREALIRLDPEGRLDRRFGRHGYAPFPAGVGVDTPQFDPRGRTILWRPPQRYQHKLPLVLAIRRLHPDGSLDRSFGSEGVDRLRIPRLRQAELGFDERGRLLLKASLARREDQQRGSELAVIRLRDDGTVDRSFGDHGSIHIHLPGQPHVFFGESEGEGESDGIVVKGEKALVSALSCGGDTSCRPVVALVDLGSS